MAIVGDSASLERAFARSSRGARGFNRDISQASRGAVAASLSFKGLGRSAAFATTAFIGGASLGYAIKSTVNAAVEAQRVQAQLSNVLEQQGLAADKNRAAIEARTDALSQMAGIDDELLTGTFTQFVRQTNDITKALNLNAIAANVARGRNISLQSAAQLVTKANLGMAGSLRRVGIEAEKGATATELLELLQRKYAGSAEAYGKTAAGAQERFRVALENTQEIIGNALLPTITTYLNKLSDWLNDTENQERIQRVANKTVEAGAGFVEFLAAGFDKLRRARNWLHEADPFGGKSLIELGESIPGVRGEIESLKDSVNLIAGAFSSSSLQAEIFRKQLEAIIPAARVVGAVMNTIEGLRIQAAAQDSFNPERIPSALAGVSQAQRPLSRELTDKEKLRIALAGDPDNVALLKEQRATDQRALDFANKMIRERRGNIAFFAKEAARLAGEVRATNDRLRFIAEDAARQADETRRAAQEAREKAEAARLKTIEALIPNKNSGVADALKQLQEFRKGLIPKQLSGVGRASADEAKAAQFRALGLTGTGDELAPTRKELLDQLKKVKDGLSGTLLDTDPNRNLLEGARQVLNQKFGRLNDDVARRMKELFDTLSGKKTPELTKFRHLGPNALIDRLGLGDLDATTRRRLKSSLAILGPGGTVPQQTNQFAGAGGGMTVVMHNPTFNGVRDIRELEGQLARRESRRAQVRRGHR